MPEAVNRLIASEVAVNKVAGSPAERKIAKMSEDEMHEPQPGDFDAELETLRPEEVQHIEASPGAQLVIQITVRGDDVDSLERLAVERGEQMSDVVSSLIRAASRSAA